MIPKRSFPDSSYYHVCNKSIANFKIFNSKLGMERFLSISDYYNSNKVINNFAKLKKYETKLLPGLLTNNSQRLVQIIAYCIMPDHYHYLLKTIGRNILSSYISVIQNSYTRYFNLKNNRKGPLWQSRFKAIMISSNEQLLHVSRYIHLNPTTANLVKKPEEWIYSSYREYISKKTVLKNLIISIKSPARYQKFTEDQIHYQKSLRLIKKMLLE